jgi:hypothetical protein
MFQGGQGWLSGKDAVPFVVQDSTMIIAAYLKTEVKRAK